MASIEITDGWGDTDSDLQKLDPQVANFLNKQMENYNAEKYAPQAGPQPQQSALAQGLGGFLGGIAGGNTAGWTNTTAGTSYTTTTDTANHFAFQQLSQSVAVARDDMAEAMVRPLLPPARGPYLHRLRDEIGRWHGDILQRD